MRRYELVPGQGIAGLRTLDAPQQRELRPNELRVRIRAASLNYRDLMVARAEYLVTARHPLVPLSDGAGEVVALGEAVTRFKIGDRVTTTFFPNWIEGAPTAEKTSIAPGGNADGVLAEEIIAHEQSLVRTPAHLSFSEAATLTCAGVTAWNALLGEGRVHAGDNVLLLGTGGVSIWALQLAKAAGLRIIITSSSDEKLERARAMGAHDTINYCMHPKWHREVLRLTDGLGVDLVVEVGGTGTLKNSISATKMGGTVAMVGGVSGFRGELEPLAVIGGARRLCGIFVGSRAMHEDLNRLVDFAGIHPIVDRVFPFDAARDAYAYLAAGKHFGKVVVCVA